MFCRALAKYNATAYSALSFRSYRKRFIGRCESLKPWPNDPILHPTFHTIFDAMFDDFQCRGAQTVQYFTEHLKAIEMLDGMLDCFRSLA